MPSSSEKEQTAMPPPGKTPALCAQEDVTNEAIYARVKRESNYKNTTGEHLLSCLATISTVLCATLMDIATNPEEMTRSLQHHFKSPVALKHHAQAVVTVIKYLGPRVVPESCLNGWTALLCDADSRMQKLKTEVGALFEHASDATPRTISGYINDLMNMCAALNVQNIMDVVTNPAKYRVLLAGKCKSPYTESTYISSVLSLFKYNAGLEVKHLPAYEAWSRASSEHRARHLKLARLNEPTNERQAANFVSMSEWLAKLQEWKAAPDPHSTRQSSMSFLLLAYACSMPPKRAEVGTIRVFDTTPASDQLTREPNHIIMDQALMRLTEHKTIKHTAHLAGIEEKLSPDFMTTLTDSLARWPRDHLFTDDNGQAYSRKGFSKWVRRATGRIFGGKAPGVNLLRHSFCTSLDYNHLTVAQRDAIALRCGHSASMQDQYRFTSLGCNERHVNPPLLESNPQDTP